MLTMQNRKDFAMKHGKQYISMHLHYLTELKKNYFTMRDWIRKPGVAICSCNDGLRPVIFKLEATEQTSEINYTPVR